MTGEIGHLPLPYYEASDGERVACGCGQTGCIDKLVGGPALARLYRGMTGNDADGRKITEQVQRGDADALRVLDRYYTVVAKAMIVILHSFDPDIITVSGGLSILPGLYDEVPKRWGRYAVNKKLVTKFVPAQFGSLAGMRGAALFGKNN
jgi:predicted NBD/HSP70 family sugar kinase